MKSPTDELTFGKHKGKTFAQCPRNYVEWCAENLTNEEWRLAAAAFLHDTTEPAPPIEESIAKAKQAVSPNPLKTAAELVTTEPDATPVNGRSYADLFGDVSEALVSLANLFDDLARKSAEAGR